MIPDLVAALTGALPPWALALIGAALAFWLVPGWFYGVRVKQMKSQLRQAARARVEEARRQHEARAFELAGRDPRKLVALCDEAWKVNNKPVFQRAFRELHDLGADRRDLQRLTELSTPERPVYRHPVEAAVAIERLMEQEMFEEAQSRLEETLRSFPDDEDLLSLKNRLDGR